MWIDQTVDVLPTALPDETLYNLVSRITGINGYPHAAEACRMLLGPTDDTRVGDAPVNLDHFCRATRFAYLDASMVRSSLTTADFFRRLGTNPLIEAVPHKACASKLIHTVNYHDPGLIELSHGHRHIFRWCPSCVTEDLSQYGTAYWHLTHQLPATTICTQHLTPLSEVRIPFMLRQQGFIRLSSLPENIMNQATHAVGRTSTHAVGLSIFAKNILMDASQPSDLPVILGAVQDGLAEFGLLKPGGAVRMKAFSEAVSDFYQELSDCETFTALLNKTALNRLATAIDHPRQPIPAAASIMLGYWLYSSWGLFKTRIQWRQATRTDHEVSLEHQTTDDPPPTHRSKASSKDRHRKICLDFLRTNPIATRSDFWHKHYFSCRWLARYDAAWLDSQLPISRSSPPAQLELALDEIIST